jgi:hypothetical protein
MNRLILLTAFCLSAIAPGAQNYITNGSFEYGLNTQWSHQVETGGKANFSLETNKYEMDGDLALNVQAINVGSTQLRATSITSMTTGADSLYLLRFWARGSNRPGMTDAKQKPSRIQVEIEGSETPGVVYQMHTGRTIFHLPFKAQPHTNLKITFLFQDQGVTYSLDGVEVLDQNNKESIDVLNTYIWQHNRTGTGWTAGDNDVSYLLPDGRTIWFFNDSFYGKNDVTKNYLDDTGQFVRNAVVIQEADGTLNTRTNFTTTPEGQKAYFQPPVTNWNGRPSLLWVGDAILINDTIHVHLIEVYDDGNGNCQSNGKSYMGQFSYPDLVYLGMKPRAGFCSPYETYFVENDTVYSYKTRGSGFERNMYAARAGVDNLFGDTPWEFWNGTAWVTDENQAAVINDMGADGVIKLSEGNYAHVSMPVMDRKIQISFAPAPQGPWTTRQTVYSFPNDSNHWYYMPNFHAQLPNGNYSISASANYHYNLFFAWDAFIDKYWYRQHYIQVDLLGLSPYSRKDCAGVFFGSAYRDECGECVGGTTGLEPCATGVAMLYAGCDYTGKVIGLDVGDYRLSDLEVLGFTDNTLASITLQEGYTAILFENDGFGGESKVIDSSSACLDAESFSGKTSSLIVRRTGLSDLSGVYAIRNKQSGLFMSIKDQSTSSYASVEQALYTGDASQKFELLPVGNGFYNIVNLGSRMALSTVGFSKQFNANTEQWDGTDVNITNFGGLITAQHNAYLATAVENLIDNRPTTSFATPNKKSWVQFQSSEPQVVVKYAITSSSESNQRDPKNWTLSASNDGENWVQLDIVSGFSFSSRMEERTFPITNETAYTYYRLEMECRLGNALQLAEWKLLAATNPEDKYYSREFVVQDAGDGYVRFFNRNSDLALGFFEDGLTAEGVSVSQAPEWGQASAVWKLTDPGLPIETVRKKASVAVYPNPVKQSLYVDMSPEWKDSLFIIYGSNGSVVSSGRVDQNTIAVNRVNPGYYILKIYNESDVFVTHFIKQ